MKGITGYNYFEPVSPEAIEALSPPVRTRITCETISCAPGFMCQDTLEGVFCQELRQAMPSIPSVSKGAIITLVGVAILVYLIK